MRVGNRSQEFSVGDGPECDLGTRSCWPLLLVSKSAQSLPRTGRLFLWLRSLSSLSRDQGAAQRNPHTKIRSGKP